MNSLELILSQYILIPSVVAALYLVCSSSNAMAVAGGAGPSIGSADTSAKHSCLPLVDNSRS